MLKLAPPTSCPEMATLTPTVCEDTLFCAEIWPMRPDAGRIRVSENAPASCFNPTFLLRLRSNADNRPIPERTVYEKCYHGNLISPRENLNYPGRGASAYVSGAYHFIMRESQSLLLNAAGWIQCSE